MAWVVEMTGYDPVALEMKTVRFAMGEGIPFTDVPYAPSAMQRWTSASQRIEFAANGTLSMSGDGGEVLLANLPDSVDEEAPLDAMADWVWQNQAVALYSVPGTLWSAATKVAAGILEQPVANLDVGGGYSSVLRMQIRDPRAAFETPLQPVKYLGTNVGPAGVEGDDSLKGRPKPILYGLVSNFSPPLVNSSLLIYQLADRAVTILCVRDGGVPLAAGVTRASLASLQANDPASGAYDLFSDATGTFIRLGSKAIFNLTVDADEASSEANQSHANIWARLRGTRIGSTIDTASVTAANTLDLAGAGFYWDDEISQNDALTEVLSSFSGYEVQLLSGTWTVAKMVIPSGTPVIELVQIGTTTRMKATSRAMMKLARARPGYAPNGAPPFRVNIRWGRNYTIMDSQAFAGVVSQRLLEKFAVEYRITSASDAATWNPVAQTGLWKNAPELTIDTAYQPGDDGLTSPGAVAEATRILALLGPLRGQYQTKHVMEPTDALLPGQVVKATYPRMGLSGGKLFRILEVGLTVEKSVATTEMVIGLQA